MRQHQLAKTCGSGNPDCQCGICEGALSSCDVCKGAECSLTTECPGIAMIGEVQDAICRGDLDFKDEKWIRKTPFLIPAKVSGWVEVHERTIAQNLLTQLTTPNSSCLQSWVCDLTFMMQAVLMAAVRGPDGIRKDHPVKVIMRWYRRCILISSFEKKIFQDPWEKGGGSFTGPLPHSEKIEDYIDIYLRHVDELPHHFQLHLMHAAEIIGYEHPTDTLADHKKKLFWKNFYCAIVNDAHLNPETKDKMRYRLGDSEAQWRECEEAVAK